MQSDLEENEREDYTYSQPVIIIVWREKEVKLRSAQSSHSLLGASYAAIVLSICRSHHSQLDQYLGTIAFPIK